MGEMINLLSRRKARLRAGDARQAAANRLRSDDPHGEWKVRKALELRGKRDLDVRRIESGYAL